ncbi:hypothetical protein HanRHA438_Chr15g0695511 [Helianthus annuus]|nr:hypothetical protein HanRHA438_Chr15g0695511 [Helianthus annuus]
MRKDQLLTCCYDSGWCIRSVITIIVTRWNNGNCLTRSGKQNNLIDLEVL